MLYEVITPRRATIGRCAAVPYGDPARPTPDPGYNRGRGTVERKPEREGLRRAGGVVALVGGLGGLLRLEVERLGPLGGSEHSYNFV